MYNTICNYICVHIYNNIVFHNLKKVFFYMLLKRFILPFKMLPFKKAKRNAITNKMSGV